MVVELGLQFAKTRPELVDDVAIDRQPMPVLSLPTDAHTTADEVEVCPP